MVVLVQPQLDENIGMCARAMANCGLKDLRVVLGKGRPQSERARAAAAGGESVLERVATFSTVAEAVADCRRVWATTARQRDLQLPVLTAEAAMQELARRPAADAAERTERTELAVLFGAEASGLSNSDLRLVDHLIRFPTAAECASLNLSQAVLLLGWEWQRAVAAMVPWAAGERSEPLVEKADLEKWLQRLEAALEDGGFFPAPSRRADTMARLAAIFSRAELTASELPLLHGVITALSRGER